VLTVPNFVPTTKPLPSATECLCPDYVLAETLAGQGFCGIESHSVLLHRKLLILSAANLRDQGVG
jgi:hypothetical protein